MASEAGVLPVPDSKIVRKWRLQPGKMLLIDLEQGRMIDDEELKANVVNTKPYKQWIENLRIKLDEVKCRPTSAPAKPSCPCWTASRPSASRRKTSSSC
jgi:glutamate synthase (NADPH/NADH) large chain